MNFHNGIWEDGNCLITIEARGSGYILSGYSLEQLPPLLLLGQLDLPREQAGLGAMHVVAGPGRRNAVSQFV